MEILVDDKTSFYDHNTTIIPYGSKNVKNSWNTVFNFVLSLPYMIVKSVKLPFFMVIKKNHNFLFFILIPFMVRYQKPHQSPSINLFFHKISKKI
jgi:hypothetical protein